MTIQQAAVKILKKGKAPLKAKEVARIALEESMVSPSTAKDPIQSMSQTLERNIRMNTGNIPKLQFVYTEEGRCIGLPEEDDSHYEKIDFTNKVKQDNKEDLSQLIKIYLPKDILKKVRIYEVSENYMNIEAAIISLIKKSLISSSDEILKKIKNELESY